AGHGTGESRDRSRVGNNIRGTCVPCKADVCKRLRRPGYCGSVESRGARNPREGDKGAGISSLRTLGVLCVSASSAFFLSCPFTDDTQLIAIDREAVFL